MIRFQAAKLTPEQIEDLEKDHGELIRCSHAESALKSAIDACDQKPLFQFCMVPL